jgi:hypothetical protein
VEVRPNLALGAIDATGTQGRYGLLKEFGAVNSIDCRSDNTLVVGELANLRVQKLVLH